jgi:hypothetical protein
METRHTLADLQEFRLVESPRQYRASMMDYHPRVPTYPSARKRLNYPLGTPYYDQYQLHNIQQNILQSQPHVRPKEPKVYVQGGTHYYNAHLETSTNGSHLGLGLEYHDPKCIRKQIEFYFEDSSLEQDIYLRTQMDSRGYVPATILAEFNRLKKFYITPREILNSCKSSKLLKVKNGGVKRRDMWYTWVLPGDKVQDISLSSDEDDFERNWQVAQSKVDEVKDVKMKEESQPKKTTTATTNETKKTEDGKQWMTPAEFFSMYKKQEEEI